MDSDQYSEINKWYEYNFSEKTFIGAAGVSIRYSLREPEGDNGTLVIAPGRAEFIEKYREVCWEFRNDSFGVCLVDHCGQGKSGRLLKDRQKGHVDDFDTYVKDLDLLIRKYARGNSPGPLILMGYSMGGAIGIMASVANPGLIDGLILVSPMLRIKTGKVLPSFIVEVICRLMCLAGKSKNYVWGGGPFNPENEFEDNILTSDEEKFRYNLGLMQSVSRVALGSPTFGWMKLAYRFMRTARSKGAEIDCPTVILQAGEDMLVSRTEMDHFYSKVPNCELKRYPGARHELLMEEKRKRKNALEDIRQFVYRISSH